jgi:hypothetical protein
MYREVRVLREDRMSGAVDVQGGTSAARGRKPGAASSFK